MVIYGIPNCDTVKKARKWLEGEGKSHDFHDFRKDGVDENQVALWLSKAGADTLVNKKSTTWRQLDEEQKVLNNDVETVQLLVANPTLIKRPVIENGDELLVGFTDAVKDSLS